MNLIFMMCMSAKLIKNFKNKLMTLILMEFLFLLSLSSQVIKKGSTTPVTPVLILSIFMVLDSTMGLTILISSSRNSYTTMMKLKNI